MMDNMMRILKYLHISRLFLSYFLMIVIIITICINPSNLFCSTFTITSSNTVTITTTSLRSNQRFNNIISPKIRCQELSSNNNKLFRYDDSIFLTKTTLHSAVSIPTTITESDAIIVDYNIQQYDKKVIKDPKVGVFLLNLGGPETGDDVEGFLYNLFADPDIIRLPIFLAPLQNIIALFISKRRAPKSRAAYESIGGGSPILKYSNEQANLIAKSIHERYGLNVNTYIGMRYWYPFTEEALIQIQKDTLDALVIVPLYPQFSISTSGSSLRVLQEEFSKNYDKYNGMVHTVVPSWYHRTGYINAMVDLISIELEQYTDIQINDALIKNPNQKPLHVLFSAHGVPVSYIEAGDPYQKQIIECVQLIQNELLIRNNYNNLVEIHLSYQSRVGPIQWLRPYTDDVLPELGQRGIINLIVVPISFVSEHVETLEEIDIEYRELAEEHGIHNWRRVPALNTNVNFINDMADLVIDALNEPMQSVTEACISNNVGDVELQSIDERIGMNSISTIGVQGVGGSGSTSNNNNPNPNVKKSSSTAKMLGFPKIGNENERWIGRIALFTIVMILLVELVSGQSFIVMFHEIFN